LIVGSANESVVFDSQQIQALTINLPDNGTDSEPFVADDGLANGLTRITSDTNNFTPTYFGSPTSLVTFVGVRPNDDLRFGSIRAADFDATVHAGTSAHPFDHVSVEGTIGLVQPGFDFIVNAATISFPNANSDVSVHGIGVISLTASQSISMSSGASLTS